MSSISANSASVVSYTAVTEPSARSEQLARPGQTEPSLIKTAELNKSTERVNPAAQINKAELQQAVDVINQVVELEQRSLSFSIDEESGRSVIKVTDFETNDLIKQIPTEELLKVAQNIKRLQDEMGQSIGLLINSKV